MNKLAFGFLLAFCLGYIANDFIHESKLSLIAPVYADAESKGYHLKPRPYDEHLSWRDDREETDARSFREKVIEIVESCIFVEDDYRIIC